MLVHTMIRPVGSETKRAGFRPLAALCAGLSYLALYGGLSSMCGLSALGLAPLSAGFAAAVLLSGIPLPTKTRRIAAWGLAAAAAAAALLGLPSFLEGCGRLLNRLFRASAARHPYLYETFPVPGSGTEGIGRALLSLGLLTGVWLGVTAETEAGALFVLPSLLFLAAIAWLGISPGLLWLILLTAACVLRLLQTEPRITRTALIPAALLGLAILASALLFPGRSEALAKAEESVRDSLALRTVYYGEEAGSDRTEEDRADGQTGKKPFYRQEETDADEGSGVDWLRTARIALLILLILILLFGPALWSDRLKRRRAENRAGLDDPDLRTDVCASFLYGLRFLREAGLIPANRPFSAYAEDLRGTREAFAKSYEDVVPIWQEAAYSSHPLNEEQRAAVRAFREAAKALAEEKMTRRQRFRARYLTAL